MCFEGIPVAFAEVAGEQFERLCSLWVVIDKPMLVEFGSILKKTILDIRGGCFMSPGVNDESSCHQSGAGLVH